MTHLELTVPGDKSIAHRALILSPLAEGDSRITNLPDSADVVSTLAMMRAFGADIVPDGARALVRGRGIGGLRAPGQTIDCGNSGTTARIGIGLAATLAGTTEFDGDASLRRRPMARVADPLMAAGAHVIYRGAAGCLPLSVTGGQLRALHDRSATTSAQVKSALLVASVAAGVETSLGVAQSRDHTERMLRAMGMELRLEDWTGGEHARFIIRAQPPYVLRPIELEIPGDASSAAFMLAAAVFARLPVVVRDVGINPGRTGFLDILRRMQALVTITNERERGGEPVGDVRIAPSALVGTQVGGALVVRAIDELPLVAVLAARASGATVVTDAGELRAKESDRIAAVCANLATLGVRVEERADGFVVHGSGAPIAGRAQSLGDHRIAMAFAVLGLAENARVEVDDLDIARVSYPGFAARLAQIRDASRSSIGGVA